MGVNEDGKSDEDGFDLIRGRADCTDGWECMFCGDRLRGDEECQRPECVAELTAQRRRMGVAPEGTN